MTRKKKSTVFNTFKDLTQLKNLPKRFLKNGAVDEITWSLMNKGGNPKIKKIETVKEALKRGVKIEIIVIGRSNASI